MVLRRHGQQPAHASCRHGCPEALAPGVNAFDLDSDYRVSFEAQYHRSILRVFVAQVAQREHVFVGILDHVRLSVNQDVGQVGPFFFVMVDDECDAWILRYVAQPLEPGAGQALGLLVNHEIKVRDLVEPEANRDIVRDARVVGRGEPGDTRA